MTISTLLLLGGTLPTVRASFLCAILVGISCLRAAAQGGTTPYTYYFRLYKDGAVYHNSGWISADNYRIDFTEAGTYTMSVRVQDNNGNKSDWVSGGKTTVK